MKVAQDFLNTHDFVIVDIETTGLNCKTDEIIEISAVRVENDTVTDEFSNLVHTDKRISSFIYDLTGINNAMLENADDISTVLCRLFDFVGDMPIVGHNIGFDMRFISWNTNGLRACLTKGFLDFFQNIDADFFSLQENMDAAPAELKPRILAFKALADDEKDKQAADFWDTLTLTVGQKKLKAQVEAAKRARAGHYEETNDLIKDYNAKVFAKASKYTGEKEQTK